MQARRKLCAISRGWEGFAPWPLCPSPLSLLAGCCSLWSPEGRLGVCARALRGNRKEPRRRPT